MANNINISSIKKTSTITDGDYVLIESPTLGTRLIKKKHLFSNLGDLGIKSLSSIGNTVQISSLSDYNNIEVRTTTNLGSGVTLPPTAGGVYTYTENRLASLSGSVNTNISSLRSLYNGTHLTLSGVARIPTLTGDTFLSGSSLTILYKGGNGLIQRWNTNGGAQVASLNYEGRFECFDVTVNDWYHITDDNAVEILNDYFSIRNNVGDIVSFGSDVSVDTVFYGNVFSPNISALSSNLLSLSSASLNNNTTRVYGSGNAASPITRVIATGEANKTYHVSGKFITSNGGGACFTVDALASTNGSSNFTVLHGTSAIKDHPAGGSLALDVLENGTSLELYYSGGGTDKYTYFMDIIKV